MIADSLLCAPDWMLAELRTITCVIGRPPIRPDSELPTPCATSSRLVGVTRLCGSSLSVASRQSRVSRLPTTAMVAAITQTAPVPSAPQSGEVNCCIASSIEAGVGTSTRWSGSIAMAGANLVVSSW